VSLFGARYAEGAMPFRIFSTVLLLRVYSWAFPLLVSGRTKPIAPIQVGVTTAHLGLALLFLHLLGSTGAAVASLCQTVMTGIALHLYSPAELRAQGGGMLPWRPAGRVLGFSVAAVLPVAPLAYLGLPATAVLMLAAAVYGPVVILLGSRLGGLDLDVLVQGLDRAGVPARLSRRLVGRQPSPGTTTR